MALCLGLDTSNYTTSVALFDGTTGYNLGKLLEVPEGTLGLRQSDALFQHVKRLPDLFHQLKAEGRFSAPLAAVGASTRPRAVEGSYMPCFLAGANQAQTLSDVLDVPFYPCSHQQGHIAAAAWSAGRADLLDRPHLAWHLSGGTTELLYVQPEGHNVRAERIGGTSDISAGQLIDRTGVSLGLAFPAGKAVDALAQAAERETSFAVKCSQSTFSLSGVENKVKALIEQGETPEQISRYVLATVARVLRLATRQALEQHPGLPVLCSGGVASNSLIRATLERDVQAVFAPPQYSTDNALGVAILAYREWKGAQEDA